MNENVRLILDLASPFIQAATTTAIGLAAAYAAKALATWQKKQSHSKVDLLAKRFRLAASRLGLTRRDWQFNTSLFRPPVPKGGQFPLL